MSFNEKLLCYERGVMPAFVWTNWNAYEKLIRIAYLSVQVLTGVRMRSFYSSMALQPFVGPWPLLQYRNLFYTVGRTP
jgi:hypothetical protein